MTQEQKSKIDLFLDLFKGRNDAYGMEVNGCVKKKLTPSVVRMHLKGKKRIGRYPLSPDILDGKGTFWVAADIDKNDLDMAIRFQSILSQVDIPCYIERSKSKGFHCWLFFFEPVKAIKASSLMRYAVEVLREDTGYEIKEIFPKQSSIKNGDGSFGFGNYLYLPLFGADVKEGRTVFLDPNSEYQPYQNQWDFLQSIERVNPARLDKVIEMDNIDFQTYTPSESSDNGAGQKEFNDYSDFLPCVSKMAEGVEEGRRNVVAFTLAKHFRARGFSQDITLAVWEEWNKRNKPPLDFTELDSVVKSTYQGKGGKGYASLGCDNPLIKPFCALDRCPVWCKYYGEKSALDSDSVKEVEGDGKEVPEQETEKNYQNSQQTNGEKPENSQGSIPKQDEGGEKQSLKKKIVNIRKGKGQPFKKKRQISDLIIKDMKNVGKFYKTGSGQFYWFDEITKSLYLIGDELLGAFINDRYGINQSETEYDFLLEDLLTEVIMRGDVTEVHRFAFYDDKNHLMYVHNGAGGVFKLDGTQIQLADNGVDGVVFLPDPFYEPFKYEEMNKSAEYLAPLVINPINFVNGDYVHLNKDDQRFMFRIWLVSLFFESLLPTKVIQVFIGEKGSGKSTTQRIIGKMLFGSRFDVTPFMKEDDYDATVSNNYMVCFDNVEGRIDWLNDRLAQTATGQIIQKRELYTTNKSVRFFPKCFLSLNAREPKFKRDDVVDRLLLFRLERLSTFRSENSICDEILAQRDKLMSELLNDLNSIVATLSKDKELFETQHRMADWATLGWKIAKGMGEGDRFKELLEKVDKEQSKFLLEDDPIFLCLCIWIDDPKNQGEGKDAKQLFEDFKEIAEREKISFYFTSPQGFGMHLRNIKSNLAEFFDVESYKKNNKWTYVFQKKSQPSS